MLALQLIPSFLDPEFENVVVTQNIDEIGEKIFNLKAFGEDLKLIVNKNDELATPHADVIKRHNGRTVSWERIADTYHTGFVDSKPGSCLTVKIKDGYLVCAGSFLDLSRITFRVNCSLVVIIIFNKKYQIIIFVCYLRFLKMVLNFLSY